ncbi:hypothetical protein HMPREF3230_00563 [Gardnerella vaginalis]|uniref:Uncharacterized protein n=1 Tax=Gardnerella vaginalis TaxID=2702 RepID=A0A135Z812_GARVA|nr:hypothetical protein HMPREF3230_00563 [Gardnerella vaginalis]
MFEFDGEFSANFPRICWCVFCCKRICWRVANNEFVSAFIHDFERASKFV